MDLTKHTLIDIYSTILLHMAQSLDRYFGRGLVAAFHVREAVQALKQIDRDDTVVIKSQAGGDPE